jgi:hypothetical protein
MDMKNIPGSTKRTFQHQTSSQNSTEKTQEPRGKSKLYGLLASSSDTSQGHEDLEGG